MSDVRLVTRTHYQVLEPALLSWLIVRGTSPVSSSFPDRIARKLSSAKGDLNVVAARYLVDLGKALKLVNEHLVWTNLGHLLNIVRSDEETDHDTLHLSEKERIVFFRIFLAFDGAALLFFAKKIEAQGTVPATTESWAQVAQELFETTYQEYLQFELDSKRRVRLRELADRRKRRPFRGKSGAHQSWVHIHTLYRLGLVDKVEGPGGRMYGRKKTPTGGVRPTLKFLELVPDLSTLEKVISSGQYYDLARSVLGYSAEETNNSGPDFCRLLHSGYEKVMRTGVPLCPIQTLTESIQVQSINAHARLLSAEDILQRLRTMQQDIPSDIRFHVDRAGYPAYIKMGSR